jgi:hypothetical protein
MSPSEGRSVDCQSIEGIVVVLRSNPRLVGLPGEIANWFHLVSEPQPGSREVSRLDFEVCFGLFPDLECAWVLTLPDVGDIFHFV